MGALENSELDRRHPWDCHRASQQDRRRTRRTAGALAERDERVEYLGVPGPVQKTPGGDKLKLGVVVSMCQHGPLGEPCRA